MKKLIINLNNNNEIITYYITIVICSLIPFVVYPKYAPGTNIIDLFMFYKSISIYFLAALSLIVLLSQGVFDLNVLRVKFKIKTSLCLFIVWAIISTYFSSHIKTSIFGLHLQCFGLLTYICLFVFYTLVRTNFDDKYLQSYINITLFSSSIMVLLCLLQSFDIHVFNYVFSESYNFATNIYATFGNSNFVGSYFSLMLPLSLMMLFKSEKENDVLKYLFFTVANCIGLLISGSRISLISALLSCIFGIYFTDDKKENYGKLVAIVFLSFCILFLFNINKGEKLINNGLNVAEQVNVAVNSDVRKFGSKRIYIYENIIKNIFKSQRNAFVGVGPDCLTYYNSTSEENTNKYPELAGYTIAKAHSDLLEYAASMGIPSSIFYSCFVLSILSTWCKKIKAASPEKRCVFIGWLGYLIQSLFNAPSIAIVGIFFVFSAIIDD